MKRLAADDAPLLVVHADNDLIIPSAPNYAEWMLTRMGVRGAPAIAYERGIFRRRPTVLLADPKVFDYHLFFGRYAAGSSEERADVMITPDPDNKDDGRWSISRFHFAITYEDATWRLHVFGRNASKLKTHGHSQIIPGLPRLL